VAAVSLQSVQFHPERSGRSGLHLIRNFVAACTST
jgi:imidazoleglycerol phosphate synthase glutamine amidotransferase subunit HisH